MVVRRTDLNGDGVPDITKYFIARTELGEVITDVDALMLGQYDHLRLTRKESDTNFDGITDVVRHYSLAEQPIREELDTNFDGVFDVVSLFEDGRRSASTLDASNDGNIDTRRVYRAGSLVRTEYFTPGIPEPTLYEYYEDNQLVRIGEDFNGDAVVDQWTRRRTGNVAPVARRSGLTAGAAQQPDPAASGEVDPTLQAPEENTSPAAAEGSGETPLAEDAP